MLFSSSRLIVWFQILGVLRFNPFGRPLRSGIPFGNNLLSSDRVDENWYEILKLLTPGLDNTRLLLSLTAGAGTRCMSFPSSSPSLDSLF